jgi:hypothetical protein
VKKMDNIFFVHHQPFSSKMWNFFHKSRNLVSSEMNDSMIMMIMMIMMIGSI